MSGDPVLRRLAAAEVFAEARVPAHVRDRLVVTCTRRGYSITIAEARPPWNPELTGAKWTEVKVAQLRFDYRSESWSLYCCDSDQRWWPYDGIDAASSVDPLPAEIDADPSHRRVSAQIR